MNYSTTTEFQSALIPGLTYTLRKMSARRRVEFKTVNAGVMASLRDTARKLSPLQTEAKEAEDAAKLEPCSCGETHEHKFIVVPEDKPKDTTIRCTSPGCKCRIPQYRDGLIEELGSTYEEYSAIRRDEYYPAIIKWGVASVAGLDVDGAAITVDGILDLPEQVVDEIGDKIDSLFSLSVDEQLGFNSPGTSTALAAGPLPITSAATAG